MKTCIQHSVAWQLDCWCVGNILDQPPSPLLNWIVCSHSLQTLNSIHHRVIPLIMNMRKNFWRSIFMTNQTHSELTMGGKLHQFQSSYPMSEHHGPVVKMILQFLFLGSMEYITVTSPISLSQHWKTQLCHHFTWHHLRNTGNQALTLILSMSLVKHIHLQSVSKCTKIFNLFPMILVMNSNALLYYLCCDQILHNWQILVSHLFGLYICFSDTSPSILMQNQLLQHAILSLTSQQCVYPLVPRQV